MSVHCTVLGFYWFRKMGIVLGVVLEEGPTCDAPALLPAGVRCEGFVPTVSTWVLYGLNPGIFFLYSMVLGTISFVLVFVVEIPPIMQELPCGSCIPVCDGARVLYPAVTCQQELP